MNYAAPATVHGAISLEDVTLGYERHPAVHHVSLDIPAGSLVAIVGPNGGGKSTLLKGIQGSIRPMGGRISLNGFSRRDIAWLPQQAEIDRGFPLSVAEIASMGLWRQSGLFGGITLQGRDKVHEALHAVGLEGFEARLPSTLSGGQLQRALFARLVVQDAPVILLDEPFTGVDQRTRSDLMGLIRRWHEQGRTILAVLHDHSLVADSFPQAMLLAREIIAWGPTREVMTAHNLTRARTMSEAWDDEAEFCERP